MNAWPTINGTAINTEPPPRLTLTALENWIYLRVQTSASGQRDVTAPTIVAKTAEEPSIHHIPDSDLGTDQNGDYYILLAKTESDGAADPKPKFTGEGRTGDLYWPQILREIKGESTGASAFTATADYDTTEIDQTAWDADWDDFDLWEIDVPVETRDSDAGVFLQAKVRVPVLRSPYTAPFFCAVVNNTTISVGAGEVWGFDGAHPAVSTNLSWSATNIGSLSGSGSVWLEVEGTKHNVIFYDLAGDLTDPIGLARYVPTSIIGLTASTPTAGTNWPGAGSTTGRFFIKILDFTGGGTALAISKQYVRDNIYISEFVIQADGEI